MYGRLKIHDLQLIPVCLTSVCDSDPADVPPGQNTTTDVPEDGFKYFKAKCSGLSGNVIISTYDIVGKVHIFASTTVRNTHDHFGGAFHTSYEGVQKKTAF